jgi:hypothetical protein
MVAVGVALFFAGYTLLDFGYVKVKGIPGITLYDMVLPSHRSAVVSAISAGAPSGPTAPPGTVQQVEKQAVGSPGNILNTVELTNPVTAPFAWLKKIFPRI